MPNIRKYLKEYNTRVVTAEDFRNAFKKQVIFKMMFNYFNDPHPTLPQGGRRLSIMNLNR